MTTIIETDALTKRYRAAIALNNLSLQVPRNKIFGFLGPNGAGKSTSMKLLLGLIRPTSGRATIFGHHCFRRNLKFIYHSALAETKKS